MRMYEVRMSLKERPKIIHGADAIENPEQWIDQYMIDNGKHRDDYNIKIRDVTEENRKEKNNKMRVNKICDLMVEFFEAYTSKMDGDVSKIDEWKVRIDKVLSDYPKG